ncbi:hypothetical protein JVU11DRAFT_11860 [Chiua virens]|nr:hypothetical protein JVU11DRAFT_11860 [Chiua virens]
MSFYNLDSVLDPMTKGSLPIGSKSEPAATRHNTHGSCLIAEDIDGTEELIEEDVETWLDEKNCAPDQEHRDKASFDMEYDIDFRAHIVIQVLEAREG